MNRFDWLDERVNRARRIGRELNLHVTWTPEAARDSLGTDRVRAGGCDASQFPFRPACATFLP
jgi:hypothetical protein